MVCCARVGIATSDQNAGASRLEPAGRARGRDCLRRARRRGRKRPDRGRAAAPPARHRALRGLLLARDRPEPHRLRAPVSALDRRRRQAAVDRAAARHGDRRLRPRRLDVPRRHPLLEGVRLRRPAGRDPLHRACSPAAAGSTPPTNGATTAAPPRSRPSGGGAAPFPSARGGRTRSRASATAGSATRRDARRCSASACSSSRPTAIPARCTSSRATTPSTSPISSPPA